MAEHDDFDDQVFLPTARETEQLDETDEGNVEEREGHAPSSASVPQPKKVLVGSRMTFSAPTGTEPFSLTILALGKTCHKISSPGPKEVLDQIGVNRLIASTQLKPEGTRWQ